MKIIDLNILLYAVNQDSAHHKAIIAWLNDAMDDDEPIGFAWVVLLGFMRLSTNPRIFPQALSPNDAITMVDRWVAHPNTRVLTERDDHWEVLRDLLLDLGTAANLVTDTHLAAVAITHGAVLVSCDTDYARFQDLRWENPLKKVT